MKWNWSISRSSFQDSAMRKSFTAKEVHQAWDELAKGIPVEVSVVDFRQGMDVELEHQDVTGGDPVLTGMIALAHLKEDPRYYEKLARMERGQCG